MNFIIYSYVLNSYQIIKYIVRFYYYFFSYEEYLLRFIKFLLCFLLKYYFYFLNFILIYLFFYELAFLINK